MPNRAMPYDVFNQLRGPAPTNISTSQGCPPPGHRTNTVAGEQFHIEDSGRRQKFPTGMVRDVRSGKGRYDLLPYFVLDRDAKHYEAGAVKYANHNWEKGQPFSRALDSALRHIFTYLRGGRSEDHLAAARFNLACVMHYEEMISRGLLPRELNDLPPYGGCDTGVVHPELVPHPLDCCKNAEGASSDA